MEELINRRYELESRVAMNMVEYAEEWRRLAADFEALGAMSNAALCQAKANYYATIGDAEPVFLRIFEARNLVRLIPGQENFDSYWRAEEKYSKLREQLERRELQTKGQTR